jgi:hypothetical protein
MKGSGMTGGSRYGRVLRYGASVGAVVAVAVAAACYSTGGGSPPVANQFYFPVGLAVSAHGNVLYVANSDFDLQFNGGTVQSYDLRAIRLDTVRLLTGLPGKKDSGFDYLLPFAIAVDPANPCPSGTPPIQLPNGGKRLGWLCAPPMQSTFYFKDAVTTGAFATTLEIAKVKKSRLFLPVRGDASLTWIDIEPDDSDPPPTQSAQNNPDGYHPYFLNCARGSDGRCSPTHQAGNQLPESGNTRGITMPGEPFGMAQTDDGVAIAITHQSDTKTSLLLSGVKPGGPPQNDDPPSLQFVLDGLPTGGVGVASVPHDPAAVPITPYPAFLQTSRSAAEVDLLRYHPDLGIPYREPDGGLVPDTGDYPDADAVYSSNYRPYLIRERAYTIAVNSSGVDSRSIAIDPTPRLKCEANLRKANPTIATTDPAFVACAQLPARVFIANRAPASLLLGQIGESQGQAGGAYDPDALVIFGNVPLSDGPSSVALAPIVDKNGNYALRVFIACYDSQRLYIYDPDAQRVENIIRVGTDPYALAFDPFDWTDVATGAHVPDDPHAGPDQANLTNPDGTAALKTYRFAYIANFTMSYLQIMDLDSSFVLRDSNRNPTGDSSFETVVYTLGTPMQPKGQ